MTYEVGDTVFWATDSTAGELTFIGHQRGTRLALTKLQGGSMQPPSKRYRAMAARRKNGAIVTVIAREFKTTAFIVRKAIQCVERDTIAAKRFWSVTP